MRIKRRITDPTMAATVLEQFQNIVGSVNADQFFLNPPDSLLCVGVCSWDWETVVIDIVGAPDEPLFWTSGINLLHEQNKQTREEVENQPVGEVRLVPVYPRRDWWTAFEFTEAIESE